MTTSTCDRRFHAVELTLPGSFLVVHLAGIAKANDDELLGELPVGLRARITAALKKIARRDRLNASPYESLRAMWIASEGASEGEWSFED